MKRLIAILLISLMSLSCFAESRELSVWANINDPYYHTDRACGSYELYAMSVDAAVNFGKVPCPVCAANTVNPFFDPVESDSNEEDGESVEVTCTERGGTWVFCFPANFLDSVEKVGTDLPDSSSSMLGALMTNEIAATVALPTGDGLLMSLRVIDDRAYTIIRPKKDYKTKRPFKWVAAHLVADVFSDEGYTVEGVSEEQNYIPPKKMEKGEKAFSAKYEGIEIDVYDWSDGHIAVIHSADSSNLTGTVTIGDSAIPAAGYISKKEAVYCIPLTDQEVQMLEEGVVPFITSIEEDGRIGWEETDNFRPVATLVPGSF